MPRKILFIIIGALLFLALLALLWFWFLHRSPAAGTLGQSGFATSSDRTTSTDTAGNGGNTAGTVAGQDYTVSLGSDGYLLSSAGGINTLAPGTYRISQGGRIVGTYALGKNAIGAYTLTPQGATGGGTLAPQGATGGGTLAPQGATGGGTLTPQGATGGGTLPPGSYTFTPLIIGNSGIGGTINTGNGIPPGSSIGTGLQGTTTPNTTGTATSTGIGTGIGPVRSGTTTPQGGVTTGAWLGSSVSERIFTPSDIAGIDNITVGGTPFISTTPQAAGLGTSGLILGLAAAGCAAQYLLNEAQGATQAATTDKALALTSGPYVVVFDAANSAKQNNTKFKSIEDCLVKTIARAAIDQITRSVVNWINSGFNGQPSFVTNFNQYFANVADQAAGEFIKGSALSFLCSPFASKIKIAIAQSYANRNAGATCSLTKITNNINGFLKGTWGAGGWGGLLQFTTMPTNNPYGAYAYAQLSLNATIAGAQNNANRNVSPGGFISLQKCDTPEGPPGPDGSLPKKVCKVTTPGAFIEESLKKSSISAPIDGLNLAQNINDIINALTNQVMIKALYGGLGSAVGITNPLAPAIDQGASAQAQALLAGLQASANYAAQYGAAKQGSASDIQQVQNNFNTLFNCWQTVASSTSAASAQGTQGAANANAQILQLQAQVDALNNDITRANDSLASIQNLQSQVLFAATPEDVTAAANAIQAAGSSLISQADVTTAQQNRAALQTQLTATNQQAQAGLAQCRAVH